MTRTSDSPVLVVKLGGRALDTASAPAELATDLLAWPGFVVVVHGGGAEVSDWCGRLGVETAFEDGLRVTDAATLEIATAVLAGLANKRLVAALRAAGVDAVGLSAVDGGVAELRSHPNANRLGLVGAIRSVDTVLLETLFADGRVPVLASLGAREGQLLNLNADDLAAALAAALGARALVLLSDTPGVRLAGAVVRHLSPAQLEEALAGPDVTGGMIAKLVAAGAAVAGGVAEVHVAAWDGPGTLAALLAGEGLGTRIADPQREEALAND